MSDENPNCPRCGRARKFSAPGSITQWISACQCDLLLSGEFKEIVQLCANCGKRIGQGAPGSFTQWVFFHDSCKCENPSPLQKEVRSTRESVEQTLRNDGAEVGTAPSRSLQSLGFPLDRYTPMFELGAGGNGLVYLCWDEKLNKAVAVKVLIHCSTDSIVLFHQEAKFTARVKHPNIVNIIDFGVGQSKTPYMVLEYVKGRSLSSVIERDGSLELDIALELFIQMAEALDTGHQASVFHRDVKCSNVIVSNAEDGFLTAHIIDFGIAAVIQEDQRSTSIQGMTIIGTPKYMPPDQIKGRTFDARSEIYSFGCLMFECLSGRPPYSGEDALELMQKHVSDPIPRLDDITDEVVPSSVASIVEKCMRKEPEERYPDMLSLRNDLVRVRSDLFDQPIPSTEMDKTFLATISSAMGSVSSKDFKSGPSWKTIAVWALGLMVLAGSAWLVLHFSLAKVDQERQKAALSTTAKVADVSTPVHLLPLDRDNTDVPLDKLFRLRHENGELYAKTTLKTISDADLERLIQVHPDLYSLHVPEGSVTKRGIELLRTIPINHLAFTDSDFGEDAVEAMGSLPFLTRLNLKGCSGVTDRSVDSFRELKLRELYLSKTAISDEGLASVAQIGTLRHVYLYRTPNVTASGIRLLGRLPHLEELGVDVNDKAPDYFSALADLDVPVLDLSGERPDGSGASSIPPECLKRLKNRKSMVLTLLRVDNDSLEQLALFPGLSRLTLFFDEFTDANMPALAKLKLKELVITNATISDTGLLHLATMNSLKNLQISRTPRVTAAGLDTLRKKLPGLQIRQ